MRLNPTDERRRRLGRSSGDPDRALYEFNRMNGLSTITAADWPFHQNKYLIARYANGNMGRIKAQPHVYLQRLYDSATQEDTRLEAVRVTQIPGLHDTLLVECFLWLAGYGPRVSRQSYGGRWVTEQVYPVVAIYFPVSVHVTDNKGFGMIGTKSWVGRTGGRRIKAQQFRDEGAKYAAWNYIESHARPDKFGHAYMNWLGHETVCGAVGMALPPRQPIVQSYESVVERTQPLYPTPDSVPPELLEAETGFWHYRALAEAYQRWRSSGFWNPILFSTMPGWEGPYWEGRSKASGGHVDEIPKAHENGCAFPWDFVDWAKDSFDLAFLGVPHRGVSRRFMEGSIERGHALTYNPRV